MTARLVDGSEGRGREERRCGRSASRGREREVLVIVSHPSFTHFLYVVAHGCEGSFCLRLRLFHINRGVVKKKDMVCSYKCPRLRLSPTPALW